MKVLYLLLLAILCSCSDKKGNKILGAFGNKEEQHPTLYDLNEIQNSGTLIGITLNGPDTYYKYRGQGTGTQFLLAEDFARHIGVKLIMETAKDTAELTEKLLQGEADFIALGIGEGGKWQTRDNTPQLTKAIAEWWNPARVLSRKAPSSGKSGIKRKMRPYMRDKSKGVISAYDDLLIKAAESIGWDWRLLAAQCYQESGFDPDAESWVGAKGLMQIMPGTAAEMGISAHQLSTPSINISAAARYIKQLNRSFSDIQDKEERTKFVLAAYNGGALHIRDAMALARKYGRNDNEWEEVATYVLKLAEPTYYKDPCVANGYMRGSETEAYVRQILERWDQYKGYARPHSRGSMPTPSKRNLKDGKHQTRVKSAEEFTTGSVLPEKKDSVSNQNRV